MARWEIYSGMNEPLRIEAATKEEAEKYGKEKFPGTFREVRSVASMEAADKKVYGPPKEYPVEKHQFRRPLFYQTDDEDTGEQSIAGEWQ